MGGKSKGPCKEFFSELIKENGLDIDVNGLMDAISNVGPDALSNGYIYDGASAKSAALTTEKLRNANSEGATTVAAWSARMSQREASSYDAAYGFGILMYEILHEQMIGGGLSHSQMLNTFQAMGATDRTLGHNAISNSLGKL